MPYDPTRDPFNAYNASRDSFGAKGRQVTPHDVNDLNPYAKAIEVIAAGNLKYLPVGNADDAPIIITNAPFGYRPPHRVRRVFADGTTATVITVED